MIKSTKHSIQWFYELLEKGECNILDFKENMEDRAIFGKPYKSFAPKYDELARDVIAFSNKKGGFIFFGIIDGTKAINHEFELSDDKVFELISQIQDRTFPAITLQPHKILMEGKLLLVLEIPFTKQIHRTSQYLRQRRSI